MNSKKHSKIAYKLFFITALTFTTVLICALIAQAYYFNHTYIVVRLTNPTKYVDMIAELDKTDMSKDAIGKIMQKYRKKYNMESAVFEADKTSVMLISSRDPVFEEALAFYQSDIVDFLANYDNYFNNGFTASGNITEHYSLCAAPHLNDGRVLFVMFPVKTPGLVDQYYIYVLISGIVISFLFSFLFSLTISKPLVKINRTAKSMANLNFSLKIKLKSNDEIGQLSNSLNLLSEKLNTALNELTTANTKLESDIIREREMEKDREEFVANISHELKTPLAIIKGYSEALKDNVRVDKKGHYLDQIIQQADMMSKLVEDMLELSRMESGHYKPQISDFDIIMLARSVIESLRLLMDEKNLHISLDSSQPLIIIQADRIKIGQVISNFVHNAIRYTPNNGCIYIRITENSTSIRFEVENEGVNIGSDKLDKVWGRFYREEKARNKKTGGTGLGLALSEKILQAHNMSYGVENTKLGVMFYFST